MADAPAIVTARRARAPLHPILPAGRAMIDGIPDGIVDGKPPHDGGKSQTGAAGRRRKEKKWTSR